VVDSRLIRLFAFLLTVLQTGCGPTLYTFNVLSASSVVHEAEQSGAAERAPYEYWLAHEYLEKAAEEANEGHYLDATRFAERARDHADRARRATSGQGVEPAAGAQR
jgi:hypothetical protein